MKQTNIKNYFNRCGFFSSYVDSSVASENLQDEVISEDGNTEFLNIDGNIVIWEKLSVTDIVDK